MTIIILYSIILINLMIYGRKVGNTPYIQIVVTRCFGIGENRHDRFELLWMK